MIKITIFKTERHEFAGFNVEGHADYSEEGQDIICAAVSVLVMNTINAIDKYTSDVTSLVSDDEAGVIEFHLTDKPSHDAELLLNTMLLGLEEIEDDSSYEPYIDIIFKEV